MFVDSGGTDYCQGAPEGVANMARWKLPGCVISEIVGTVMPGGQFGLGRDLEQV